MILSRTMRSQDYLELHGWCDFVRKMVYDHLGGWDPKHNMHRMWEYAMAIRALTECTGLIRQEVADVGAGTGYLSPALLALGCNVTIFESWQFGNEAGKVVSQMNAIKATRHSQLQKWRLDLDFMQYEGPQFDAVFCLSTLEHAVDDFGLLTALARKVKVGGLLFLTVDFAQDGEDHYPHKLLRRRIYNKPKLEERALYLQREFGFTLLGDQCDWEWREPLVEGSYTFASLAMVRRTCPTNTPSSS